MSCPGPPAGGGRLMPTGLERRPAPGEAVRAELRFGTSGPVAADLPVRAADQVPGGTEHSGHGGHGRR